MQYVPSTIPGYAPDFFGAGKHGFQDGDPATGTQGTEIASAIWNDWLGNLMKICELAGVATAPGQLTDLANGVLGLAAGQPVQSVNTDNFAVGAAHIGELLNYGTSAAAFTTSLPDTAGLPALYNTELRCEGPFPLTVNAHAGTTIEGLASVTIYAGESLFLLPFGTVWKTKRGRTTLYRPGFELFPTAGTTNHTVRAGVSIETCLVWGAGGTGSWDPSISTAAGGGGLAIKRCVVKPGDVIPVTVGAANLANRASGGTSSFGSFASATGGAGGTAPGSSVGGAGGVGVGGDVNLAGQGGSGFNSQHGGCAPFGGQGGTLENTGGWPGGGGGGGIDAPAGGPGADGGVLVLW